MSLRRQFFLSVLFALVLGLSLLAVVACWHARASVENEMRMALEAGDHVVDNALLSLPQSGTDVYLERLVRSFDDNRHVQVTLREGKHVVAVSRLAAPDPVPGWYRRLLEIPVDQRWDTAPRLGGRSLLVTTDASNEIGEAWVQFRDGATILALFSLVVLGLLHLVMAHITAPLNRLRAGFDAVGGGNYQMQVPPAGAREIALLAQGFNRMTEKLHALESANRRLTGQMLAIQEEERADLARDLHDEMGPFLFAVQVDADAILAEAQRAQQAEIATRARNLAAAVSHIQRQVRVILRQLRPEGLVETGLSQAIANLVTFWQRHHDGIAIHLDIAAARGGFGAEADAAIYRLVQEGLTNAARHGAAHTVWIAITAGDMVVVTVEDDGVGLSDASAGGMGLKGMRERLAALSGRLAVEARAGGGVRLVAAIPHRMAPA